MASKAYVEQAENLIKAIDIAIEVIKTNPPKGFNEQHVQIYVEGYYTTKKQIIEAEPKFQTLASLKYDISTVFSYFNEGSGRTVNEFWNRIKENGLPYERENKLEKILSKKKIKNQQEYDYVIDTMVPFKQEGMISETDFELLNRLIGEYETKKTKKR
jgi:hypothetical protein